MNGLPSLPASILIMTRDESVNIADCLRSVSCSDDVVVLDSHSSDDTLSIAQSLGARTVQRKFDDYASQRNYALRQIEFRHQWVLMLDADERLPPELVDEIALTLRRVPDDVCLFRMRRRDHLFGKWIRRSSGYPTWFPRLMRADRVHVQRAYNEEFKTEGRIESLEGHLDHFPFNKGFHEWIAKHDRYSSMEASLQRRNGVDTWRWHHLFASDPAVQRVAVKGLANALPCRPAIVFLWLYILRGGFLEGRAGLTFCSLRAWYEFMIDCKLLELKRRDLRQPV